jgi:cell division protein FtsQ
MVTVPAPATRSRVRRSGANRRHPVPLRERLPDRGQVRAACRRGVRAAMPGAITVAAVAAAGGAILLAYNWLTGSPRFALASVELRGASELEQADVERAVRPALGENLFRLPLDAIERRLRAEPWIEDVSVSRRLPDRLVVEVDEHEVAAVVDLDGLYLAGSSGRVFKRADLARGEAAGLPIVTGIGRDTYRRRPVEAQARIRDALAAAAAYGGDPARPALGEVHDDLHRGLTLYTRRPVVALRLGRPDGEAELRRRLAVFDAAWAALAPAERAALSAIHLDRDGAPVRVTVSLVEPSKAASADPR